MRFLKEAATHILTGLNVFVLFFLVFEDRIVVPSALIPVGRMHPLILHFPIVLLLAAVGLHLFRNLLPVERSASRWFTRFLLLTGALTSGITVAFGLFLSKEEGYSGDLLVWHKWTGAFVFFAASFLSYCYGRASDKILSAGMLLTSGVLLVAGHFGASLTHGEGFITETIFQKEMQAPDLENAQVYTELVVPVLKEKCFSCHNPDKAKGGLSLTDTLSLLKGGESGQLIIRGKADESLIVERLLLDVEHKHRMPPKGKPQLTTPEVELIKTWIDAGGDFRSGLNTIAKADEIRRIASQIYGATKSKNYDFKPADTDLVQSLNSSYRLILPVAYGSPALDVSFFGQGAFQAKSLEELRPVADQVVSLNLAGMPMSDAEISFVTSLPHLERLNLNQTDVTDTGIKELKKLPKLTTVLLSGTQVSREAIKELATLPSLRRLYAWNTGLSAEDVTGLLNQNNRLTVEIGHTGPDSTLLQLNKLTILPANSFFRKPFHLELQHPIHGTRMLFTLDGSTPDSSSSSVFSDPVLIESNTLVKAKPVKEGWLPGDLVEKTYQRSSIAPEVANLITFPHPLHRGTGAPMLFDLEDGSTDILYASDGKWLGYQTQDFVVDLGFNKPTTLNEIILSTLTSVTLQAFPPVEVIVSMVQPDGKESEIARLKPPSAEKDSKIERNMIRCKLASGQTVSQLRITAKRLQVLPKWHAKAGQPAWFFIDEILLN